jgi:hypothetical protein
LAYTALTRGDRAFGVQAVQFISPTTAAHWLDLQNFPNGGDQKRCVHRAGHEREQQQLSALHAVGLRAFFLLGCAIITPLAQTS